MLTALVDVIFNIGLTFGVGSSTFALIFYIIALEDAVIDASEQRFMHAVYVMLRVGMALLFVALLLNAFIHPSILPTPLVLLVLLGIITINAVLMTRRIMPMWFGPVLAGGSWYSLFLVSKTPLHQVDYTFLIIEYICFIALFYIVFTYLKNKFAPAVGLYTGEVLSDERTVLKYATDTSSFKIVPSAVYYPKTTTDIVSLVNLCRKKKETDANASLTVRAGGTCMSGGPLNAGWIIDMTKYMNRISIDPNRMTATVETGAYFRDIEDMAGKHNLMFAPYPSSRRICGIGGMLGNNASGEKSLRNGATSDNVLELEVVLADGTVKRVHPQEVSAVTDSMEKELIALHTTYGARMRTAVGDVKKSASGYRLEKVVRDGIFNAVPLFVGAQGTLGIITKAVLTLTPIPKYTELVVISGQSLLDISSIIETTLAHNPEGLETFDIHTFEKAKEHLTEHANRTLPYIDEEAHLFILAQFSEATDSATKAQAKTCLKELTAKGYSAQHITNERDAASIWEVRRNSFLLMRDHNAKNHRAVPCIEDVIIPLPALGTFIGELRNILKTHNISYGYHGHIGDGSFRVIPVFDFTSPTVSEDIIALMRDTFALVKRLKGNISADHSDGIIRTPFLKEFYGEELYGVFERVKSLYDPENIMNPNKKVGSTIEFLDKSLDKTLV